MQPQQIQTLDNNNDTLVLRDVLRKYLRYWYWFVISIVVCMAVAFIYLKTQSPKYNVSSKIMIRGEEGDGGGAESGMLQSLGIITGSKHVNDELHIIGSKTLMQQVIRTLDIQTSYFKYVGWTKVEEYPLHTIDIRYPEQFCDTMKSGVNLRIEKTSDGYHLQLKYAGEKYKYDVKTLEQPLKMPFGNISLLVNKPLNKGDEFQILTPSLPSLVESMQSGITAQQVNDESNVVTISTTSPTPRKAIDILDKLVELYNADAVIDKNLLATATGRFIDDRLRLIT
ncbi:MAG: hypothetical protein IJ680_03670, partial [Paludibacteraceae bacterium]|nr:hypothetical protein [Paludibacteraceae bacterium]